MKVGNLDSISGWLALLVFGNVAVGIYLLATIGENVKTLGDTWMLAAMIPGFRAVLFIETGVHFLQLVGIFVGLVLILRASPTAPTYWLIYYAVMIVYVFYDVGAVPGFQTRLEAALGTSLEPEDVSGTASAKSQNLRLAFNAAIWSWYWLRSHRVRVRFAPRNSEVTVNAPIIGEPSGA
jgi:hypothetical protein